MEITRDLFSFFLEKGVVTPAQGRTKGGVVRVDEEVARSIESGTFLSVVLGQMGHADKLQAVETKVNNAMTRLQNWNLLVPVLKRYTVVVPPDQKALIIAADTGALLSLYEDVRQRLLKRKVGDNAVANAKKAKKKPQWTSSPTSSPKYSGSLDEQARTWGLASFGNMRIKASIVDAVEANPAKPLTSCTSVMELLVTSMVQQLKIRASQASALLTTNKRYLAHILIHGVKGKCPLCSFLPPSLHLFTFPSHHTAQLAQRANFDD